MITKNAITNACRDLTKALQKDGLESPELGPITSRFAKRVGGQEALADILFEEFQRERGIGLNDDEKACYKRKSAVLLNYFKLVLSAIESENKQRQSSGNFNELSDEELREVLRPLATELVLNDSEFRRQVIIAAIEQDPEFLQTTSQEMITGKVVG